MFWILIMLSVLPVAAAHYPQMSDYPAHLARYHVMLDGGHSPDLTRYYGFTWRWTGNVGVDLLIRPFAAIFGLETGGRIIVGLIPPLTGLGIAAVEWALRRRVTVAGLLAMAFVWSPMMLTGMLNFALGQALALLAFALWVANERWRPVLFVPISMTVWLCHLSAWGMLGVMVLAYEAHSRRGGPHRWRALSVLWPLAAPLPVMMFTANGPGSSFSYGSDVLTYKVAIWLRAMRDTSYPLDFLGLVGVLAVLALALHAHRMDGRLGWAALILLGLSFIVPRHISGGDYADYRLVTSGLMVACLAIDWPQAPGWAMALAPGLYLARLMVTTLAWQADSARTNTMLQALNHVPQGARVANAVLVARDAWPLNHVEHIGAYAVVRRDALTNVNFAVPGVHMLSLRQGGAGFSDPSQRLDQFETQPVDLTDFVPARQADYLWYVGTKQPVSLPRGAQVIWRANDVLLARLAPVTDGKGRLDSSMIGGKP
jgi:hypothetical protein